DQEDPGKWHRRGQVFVMDYNTVVCEEAAAYAAFIKQLKAVPDLDPLVLDVLATTAVASRMKETTGLMGGPTLGQRVRMYNGEPLMIEKKATSSPVRPNGWFGSGSGLTSDSRTNTSESDEKNYSVSDLWLAAGDDEGRTGLDFGFMLSSVSQLCELGLASKTKAVTSLATINYLRARVERELSRPGLTEGSRKVLERARQHLALASTKWSTPEMVEAEYRRLLKAQVLGAFSPDYEARADDMFRKYHKHAVESGKGKDRVFDERHNRVIFIDVAHLQKVEQAMSKSGDEALQFRRSLESEFIELMREQAASKGEGDLKRAAIFTWETHPELKKAIKKILDDEIAGKVEKCLGDDTNLGEEDRALRKESLERFDRLGYSEPCRKVALAYFKEFELWK
ncbi:MAG: hypothetical protein K2V38_01565, partial [Gemmataceae bacterium]|nr:hypothetical protein [Gemmataceae bacterium]